MRESALGMNRQITVLGLVVLLIAIGFAVYPLALFGVEELDSEVEAGIFILPVGLTVILWGASSADPSVTTVGGVFGNPDEDLVRAWEGRRSAPVAARFLGSPHETTNCRQCYTAIPPGVLLCPRCGLARECRGCGGSLRMESTTPRCVSCGREEVYCSCPQRRRAVRTGPGSRGVRR